MSEASILSVYHYPNKMGRIVLLAMEEVLGRSGVNAVLTMADLSPLINCYPPNNLDLVFNFQDVSKIQSALEDLYGPLGGRGVALRSGRTAFKYGLREFGSRLGITDLAFRLLPLNEKLRTGLVAFANAFNRFSDQKVRLEETPDRIYWHIERCPLCWGRHTESPACHLAVGVLQEALQWVSSGKHFLVEETCCIAHGDPTCTIVIEKRPVE
jgi:predicted hydrocarbon binding protein